MQRTCLHCSPQCSLSVGRPAARDIDLLQAEVLEQEQRTVAGGKERVLRLREQVEALEAQLVDARSSLATYKVRRRGEPHSG